MTSRKEARQTRQKNGGQADGGPRQRDLRYAPASAKDTKSLCHIGAAMTSIIPVERIKQSIVLIRGQKVMLDRDLANLYEDITNCDILWY